MNNQKKKMLREIANDLQTPKKRDFQGQNDLYEKIDDGEYWEGQEYDDQSMKLL
tara:strand:+ start:1962 stop:2123 length:162 start_codon:yes stop_codon:yes gene_type:complete